MQNAILEQGETTPPTIGEIRQGWAIGYVSDHKHIWLPCSICETERWVAVIKGQPTTKLCRTCNRSECIVWENLATGTVLHPNTGDIRRGIEIGKQSLHKHIYIECPQCHTERWVIFEGNNPRYRSCRSCAGKFFGKNHPNWKGGIQTSSDGYVLVIIRPDSHFFPMANTKGYVLEHRLVMAKHLGRCLTRKEHVHHKDGIKHHNELANLELRSPSNHASDHGKGYRDGYTKGYIEGLRVSLSSNGISKN